MGNAFEAPSEAYADHRDRLRAAEIALKEQCEEVAALRRELPAGPRLVGEYVFHETRPASPTRFRRTSLRSASPICSRPAPRA